MAKQAQIKDDEMELEDKILAPEAVIGEDGVEDPEEDESAIDTEDMDPFHDKWEE